MLGGKGTRAIERRAPSRTEGRAALSLRGVSWRTRVRDVTIEVRPGEVVGLAGLLGSGRTELMKAVYGGERADAGHVEVAGHAIPHPTPRRSIEGGLGFLSEDRRSEGIFPLLSVRENVTASVLDRISDRLILRRGTEDEIVARFIRELGIRTSGPAQPIGQLSGGNQQKVLLARVLSAQPKAIMLDDPTRGIDVGAKAEVHRAIRALAAGGLGVLVTSSEVEELFELCDRLVVLSEGRIAGEVEVGAEGATALLAMLSGGIEDQVA
jgi:ribose transport system ATP-binding protein